MADFNRDSKIVITCPKNIAPILAKEVETLGYKIDNIQTAFVEIKGSLMDCMKLNLWLRTAHKVLYKIGDFFAPGPDILYQHVNSLPWESFISPNGYFAVNSQVFNDAIRDTRFANLKVKDAIVDRIKGEKGKRPDSGPDKSQSVVFLHWDKNKASIYFDTSGETIAKHGYRKIPGKAPMQETLAAAVVLSSKWKKREPLINPMCGSGTLGIEAALIAADKAPGLFRENFGFMHIIGFPIQEWKKLLNEAKARIKKPEGEFILTDLDSRAIDAARENAEVAGVADSFTFEVCHFEKTPVPDEKGVVVFNPEYGERLGEEERLESVYKGIGDFMKQECQGFLGYIFTGNADLAKRVGLKTKRRIPFFNGPIECRLLEYELYQGTKKVHKSDNQSS